MLLLRSDSHTQREGREKDRQANRDRDRQADRLTDTEKTRGVKLGCDWVFRGVSRFCFVLFCRSLDDIAKAAQSTIVCFGDFLSLGLRRERERERERQRERDRERERQREREREKNAFVSLDRNNNKEDF